MVNDTIPSLRDESLDSQTRIKKIIALGIQNRLTSGPVNAAVGSLDQLTPGCWMERTTRLRWERSAAPVMTRVYTGRKARLSITMKMKQTASIYWVGPKTKRKI